MKDHKILIVFLAGVLLGGLLTLSMGPTKTESLHEIISADNVRFSISGKLVSISEKEISLETRDEIVTIEMSEDAKILSFPQREADEEASSFFAETMSTENLPIGAIISVSGDQRRDGSVFVHSVWIKQQ